MFTIKASGQTIGSGRIGFVQPYLDRLAAILAAIYPRRALSPKLRGLVISGDVRSIWASVRTDAAVQFRFYGDCVLYEITGTLRPGPKAFAYLSLSALCLFAEAWLFHADPFVRMVLSKATLLFAALFVWYLVSFPFFALSMRRQIVQITHRVCEDLQDTEDVVGPPRI